MIQVKDSKVNILLIVIGFGMFIHFIQNFVAMTDRPMYFIGSVVIPIIFLIMTALFIKESMYFLLIPLIAYFSERFFILVNLGRFLIFEYNSAFISATDNLNIYLNLIRNSLALGVVVTVILAVTSKSPKLWHRSHQWAVILIIFHVLQILTMTAFRSDFFGILLQLPIFLYFTLIIYVLTHPKYYTIYFDQAFVPPNLSYSASQPGTFSHHSVMSHPGTLSSSSGSQTSNQGMAKTQICPHCAANNKMDAQVCHQCGNHLNQTPTPIMSQPIQSSSRPTPPSNTNTAITCPECQQVNHDTNYCLNCGHSLSGKGN